MIKVSACLITLNEEKNLPRALRSLQGIADEIVVVDCGSTDRTRGDRRGIRREDPRACMVQLCRSEEFRRGGRTP